MGPLTVGRPVSAEWGFIWLDGDVSEQRRTVVIVGGGPGGYEAALVAAHLGADVTVVERQGLGGAAVLTDCVPSKTLIATADFRSRFAAASRVGVGFGDSYEAPHAEAHLRDVNSRILNLASAQSDDIAAQLRDAGVRHVQGAGRLVAPGKVVVTPSSDSVEPGEAPADAEGKPSETLDADVVLLATGARPRVMDTAVPDGERILTWQQIYELDELPEHLIVVGSGVTGVEFAQAYLGLGSQVTLVSSRERVLPGEDADAANVLEDVLRRRGMTVLNRSRMAAVERQGDTCHVTLEDGRTVEGSHVLLAVGSIPNTTDLGLDDVGVRTTDRGHISVDRVSRTSVPGVYAAGDCTGVLPLASVAAMQGRIAMAHALGDAVAPLGLRGVSANIFTDPEIATVGYQEHELAEGTIDSVCHTIDLTRNPRAKMQNLSEGLVKLFARRGSGTVLGGLVVAPRASELIYPLALAVRNRLTVDQLATTFTVYPSLSGSIAEAARQLHSAAADD